MRLCYHDNESLGSGMTTSHAMMDWIGLCSVLRPRQHSIGYMGDGTQWWRGVEGFGLQCPKFSQISLLMQVFCLCSWKTLDLSKHWLVSLCSIIVFIYEYFVCITKCGRKLLVYCYYQVARNTTEGGGVLTNSILWKESQDSRPSLSMKPSMLETSAKTHTIMQQPIPHQPISPSPTVRGGLCSVQEQMVPSSCWRPSSSDAASRQSACIWWELSWRSRGAPSRRIS